MNLVDSQHCSDPGKFLAIVLTSLSTMVLLETPHVNILAKVDLINTLAPLGMCVCVCVCILLTAYIDYLVFCLAFSFGLLYRCS